ncbi:MAG: YbdD/YjiX family protein [Methylophilaceae bacterium]
MLAKIKAFWRAIRQLSGADAYERYLLHQVKHHPDKTPLTKAEFFKQWQDEKWAGIKRCC